MIRRVSTVAFGAFLAIALTAPPGAAHAAYRDSQPRKGETVSSPPSRVTVEFTEQVVRDSFLQVFDACGRQVDNRDSFVVHDRITVTMSGEARGVYVVRFDVVSAVDGHHTVGSFDFTSSGGSECPGEEKSEQEEESKQEGGSGSKGPAGTGSSESDSAEMDSASASQSSGSKGKGSRGDERAKVRGGRTAKRDASGTRDEDAADEGLAAATPASDEGEGSIWSGIPMNWLAVSLVLAAIVGAAGGFVYAGIVGPRRV